MDTGDITIIVTAVLSIATLIVTQHYQFKRQQLGLKEVKDATITAADKVAITTKGQDVKLNQIHTLVNSRLTKALAEIKALRKQLTAKSHANNPRRHK